MPQDHEEQEVDPLYLPDDIDQQIPVGDSENLLDLFGQRASGDPISYTRPKGYLSQPAKLTSSSQYLEGLTFDQNPEYVKARNQGFLDSIGNGVAQAGSEIVLGGLEGAGYLAQGAGYLARKGWAAAGFGEDTQSFIAKDGEFGNAFSNKLREWKEQFREEGAPVYTTPDDEGFQPLNYKWWATNAPSIASAVSLLIPAWGVARGVGWLAKSMGGLNLAKKLGITSQALGMAEAGAMGTMSRQMEGMMEGAEKFQTTKQEAMDRGMSEEEANRIAGEAATDTYKKNWALLALDILQFGLAFKSFKGLSRANADEAAIGMTKRQVAKQIGIQAGTEAYEEGYQYVAGEEAQRQALINNKVIKDDFSAYPERLMDYITREDFMTATFLGAVGGTLFEAAGSTAEKLSRDKQQVENDMKRRALEKDIAVLINKPEMYQKSSDVDLINLSMRGIQNGRANKVEEMLKFYRDNPVEGDTEGEASKKAQTAIDDLHYMEKIYDNYFKDPTKKRDPDMLRFEMGNRANALSDMRILEEFKVEQTKEVQKLIKERNLDSSEGLLIQAQVERNVLVNELANIPGVDKEIHQKRVNDLDIQIKTLRDTIKTNKSLTDEQLDKRISVNKSLLANISVTKALFDLKVDQANSDFDVLQTQEGQEKIKKKLDKHKKESAERTLEVLTESIHANSTAQEVRDAKEAAKQLGKEKEFLVAYNTKITGIRSKAYKYNPNKVAYSINRRFKSSKLLTDHEGAQIAALVKVNGGMPAGAKSLTPDVIEAIAKQNPKFAKALNEYYARAEDIIKANTGIFKEKSKKDKQREPTGKNPEGSGGSTDVIPKGKGSTDANPPKNRNAWNAAGVQFKTFNQRYREIRDNKKFDDIAEYLKRYDPAISSISANPKAKRIDIVKNGKKYSLLENDIASLEAVSKVLGASRRKPSDFDVTAEAESDLARRTSWDFLNKGKVQVGDKVHFEYVFEDGYNVGLTNEAAKSVKTKTTAKEPKAEKVKATSDQIAMANKIIATENDTKFDKMLDSDPKLEAFVEDVLQFPLFAFYDLNELKKTAQSFIKNGPVQAVQKVSTEIPVLSEAMQQSLAHAVTFDLVHYIDGDPRNKDDSNRMVLGALGAYDEARTYESTDDKEQLKNLRERLYQEVVSSGNKSGAITLGPTTAISEVKGGRPWNTSRYSNPLEVLRPGEKLLLGVATGNERDGKTIEVRGSSIQKKLHYDKTKLNAGDVFSVIISPNGDYYPYKLYTKKVKEVPKWHRAMLSEIAKIKDAKTKEEKAAVLATVNEIIFIRDLDYEGTTYFIDTGRIGEISTKEVTEEELFDFVGELIYEVDVNRINKEDYNKDLANNGFITTDMNPFTYFHSVKVVINPVTASKVETKLKSAKTSSNAQQSKVETTPTKKVKSKKTGKTKTVRDKFEVFDELGSTEVVVGKQKEGAKSKTVGEGKEVPKTKKKKKKEAAKVTEEAPLADSFVTVQTFLKEKGWLVFDSYMDAFIGQPLTIELLEKVADYVVIHGPDKKRPGKKRIITDLLLDRFAGSATEGGVEEETEEEGKEEEVEEVEEVEEEKPEGGVTRFNIFQSSIIENLTTSQRILNEPDLQQFIKSILGLEITEGLTLKEIKRVNDEWRNKVSPKGKPLTAPPAPKRKGGPKPSLRKEIGSYTPLSRPEVEAWMKKNLPNVPLAFARQIIEVYEKGGAKAWGVFDRGLVTLWEGAPKGTEHHEAFHAVFWLMLTQEERNQILDEAAVKYGIERSHDEPSIGEVMDRMTARLSTPEQQYYESLSNDAKLEEKLADSFVFDVVQQNGDTSTFTGKIKEFFRKIWEFIKSRFTKDIDIETLFFRINTAFYANKPMVPTNTKRYKPLEDPHRVARNVQLINYYFFQALDEHIAENKLGNVSDIDAIKSVDPDWMLGVQKLYAKVSNGLRKRANRPDTTDEQFAELAAIITNFVNLGKGGVITGTGDYYHLAVENLAKFGIRIRERNRTITNDSGDNQFDDKQNDLNEEKDKSEGWQKIVIKTNGKDTLSARVRRMLRQTTYYTLESNGEFEEFLDDYGFKTFISFDEVYNYLERNLANIFDSNAMLDKMEELKDKRPEVYGILKKLYSNDDLKSQFFSNFAKAYSPHMQVKQYTRKWWIGDILQTSTEYRVFNANRRNIPQLLMDEWYDALITPGRTKITDGNAKIDINKARESLKKFDAKVAEVKRSRGATIDDSVELSEILYEFGINIDPEALQAQFAPTKDRKGRIKYSAYENYIDVLDGRRSISTLLRVIARGENPYEGETAETSSAKSVAHIIATASEHLHQDTLFNINGEQIYSYLLPTFLNKKMQEFIDPDTRQGYLNNWWYKGNRWLQDLNQENNEDLISEFEVVLLDGLNMEYKKGVEFSEMTDYELDITDINMYNNPSRNKESSYGYYRLPILADSPQAPYVKFRKYSQEDVIDAFYQLALAEKKRIEVAQSTSVKIKHWNEGAKNGLRHHFMPIFNDPNIDLSNEEVAKQFIKQYIEESLEKEKQRLTNNGVLNKDGKFDKTADTKTAASNPEFLRNYFYNKTLSNAMLTQLLSVDLAYYENYDDFNKRNAQTYKFTKMMDEFASWKGYTPQSTYNVLYVNDVLINSEIEEWVYNDLVGKGYTKEYAKRISKTYRGIKSTDAQTFISIDRYRNIKIGYGEWNNDLERAYKIEKKWKKEGDPTAESIDVAFEPTKPFYFDHETIDDPSINMSIIAPMQHKNSEMVLLPRYAAKSTMLKKMLKRMNDKSSPVHAISFTSAVKTGIHGNVNVKNIDDATVHVAQNKYYGKQQEVPEHHIDTENLLASQIKKLIQADIPPGTMIKGMDAKELVRILQELMTSNIKDSYAYTKEELSDIKKIQEVLTEQIIDRGLGEYYKKAIELVPNKEGDLVFNLPLFTPANSRRFENILNAIVRKEVTKQKINGGSYALMSSVGRSEELKVVRSADGGVAYMEVLLPPWTKKWFPKLPNGEVDFEGLQRSAPELLELFGYRIPTEHKYSMRKLRVIGFTPSILGGIAVLPAEIVKIAGEDFDIDKMYVMIPNGRLVYDWKNLRHDFNVKHDFLTWRQDNGYDKIKLKDVINTIETRIETGKATTNERKFYKTFQTFLENSKEKYNRGYQKINYSYDSIETLTKKQRDNAIMDIIGDIWSSSAVSDQILIPGNFDTLRDLAEESVNRELTAREDQNPILPATQMSYFQRNMMGDDLIAPAAIHNVSHAITQFTKIRFNEPVKFDGLELTELSNTKTIDGKELISRNIAQFVAAFVDNVKDPVAGDLNLNMFTLDVAMMMIRLGLPIKTAISFVTQPVIQVYASDYYRNGGTRKAAAEAYVHAVKNLTLRNKNLDRPAFVKNFKTSQLKKIYERDLTKLTPEQAQQQWDILNAFEKYRGLADSLTKLNLAIRADSIGIRKSMAATIKALMDVNRVLEDKNLSNVGDLILGSNYPLVRDSIEYGVRRPLTELLANHIPFNKKAYFQLYQWLEGNKGSPLTEKEMEYVNNLSLIYYNSGFGFFNNKEKDWWVNKYPKVFLDIKNGLNVNEYQLLKYLKYKPAKREDPVTRIEFTSGATVSNDQREALTRSWDSMLSSDNEDISEFAKDLVQYSYHTNGLSFTFAGFSHLIPPNYHDKLVDDQDVNYRDYMYKLMQDADNPDLFKDFFHQLMAHNLKENMLVPTLKIKDLVDVKTYKGPNKKFRGLITSISVDKAYVNRDGHDILSKYFKMYAGDDYNTYAYSGMSSNGDYIYNIVEGRGYRRGIFEFDMDNFSDTVIEENKLPELNEDNIIETVGSVSPGDEMHQLDKERELEFKYGLVDKNGVYKSFGVAEGYGQLSTNNHANTIKAVQRINQDLVGTGYRSQLDRKKNPSGKKGDAVYIIRVIRVKSAESYQLESKTSLEPDKELNDLLRQRIVQLGFRVEDYNDLYTRLGSSTTAMVDFVEKAVKVASNRERLDSLPEEVGHMAEAFNRGSDRHRRLMELVVNTPEYREVKRDYWEIYEGNEDLIRREAIGKLIGSAIIKQTRKTDTSATSAKPDSLLMLLLKLLWEAFIVRFIGVDTIALRSEMEAIVGDLATDVLQGRFDSWNKAIAVNDVRLEGKMYQLNTQEVIKAGEIFKEGIRSINKKITIYRRRATEDFIKKEEFVHGKLYGRLEKGEADIAKVKKAIDENTTSKEKAQLNEEVKRLEEALYKRGLFDYTVNASIELKKILGRYEDIDPNPDTPEARRETIKLLRMANNYVNGFAETLNAINDEGIFDRKDREERKIANYVSTTVGLVNELQKSYYNIGKPILAEILKEFTTNPDAKVSEALDVLEKDISWFQRFMDSMAEADDSILNIMDVMAKDRKQAGRLTTLEFSKEILRLQKKLEASGVPTTHFMYERDHEGNLTGNLIDERNYGEYFKRKREWKKENPKPQKKDFTDQIKYKTAYKEWKVNLAVWYDKNTETHPGKDEIIKVKEQEFKDAYPGNPALAASKYKEWRANNILQKRYFDYQAGEYLEKTIYKGELSVPKLSIYKNEIWQKMQTHAGQKEYHDFIKESIRKADGKVSEIYKLGKKAPQVRKDAFERMTFVDKDGKKSIKSLKKIWGESKTILAEQVIKHENDLEYGITDENNEAINFLPVNFTRRLKDTSNLSLDLTSSMVAYMYSVNDYSEMSKIIDILEFTKDVVGEREVKTGKFDPIEMTRSIYDKIKRGKPLTKEERKSFAYERVVDWMKMTVYGQESKDEGQIFGADKGKLADFMNSFTSLSTLALNLYSGISNVTVGAAMMRMEAMAGEFIDNKEMARAGLIYGRHLPGSFLQSGQRLSDNKMDLWIEYFDTLQNYSRDYRNIDAGRNTVFSRLMKLNSLYFINHAGEHFIQTKMSLALAMGTIVKDEKGKEMNLWEAFSVEGDKLVLKPNLTKVASKKRGGLFKPHEDGEALTDRDIRRFINKQNFLNKRLHGIYNNVDKSAMQHYALGRMALLFRKFIKPGWNRRFAKWTYNEEGEIDTEGYYATLGRFISNIYKELKENKFSTVKNWPELKQADKANFARLLTEWAYITASIVVANILAGFADDDDNYFWNLAAYEAYRMYSEIRFFTSGTEALRIIKSPAAAVTMIEKVIKFLDVWDWNKEVERGKYKGMSRFSVGALNLIPFGGTYINFRTPEEQLRLYTNNGVTLF